MSKIAKIVFWVLLSLSTLWVAWEFRSALLVFLLALTFSSALRPFVKSFEERWESHSVATIVVHLLAVVLIVLPIIAIGPRVIEDTQAVADQALLDIQQPNGAGAEGADSPLSRLVSGIWATAEGLDDEQMTQIATSAIGATSNLLSIASYLGLMWIISLYWSLDEERLERLGFSLLSLKRRRRARYLWHRIWVKAGDVMRSEFIISLTTILALLALYLLARIPYPSLFAVWAGVARLLPWLGVVFAFMPLLLLVPTIGFPAALVVITAAVAVFFAVQSIWRRAILKFEKPSRLLTAILILMMGRVGGLLGVVLAPIAAAGLQVLLEGLYISEPGSQYADEEARLARIRNELAAVRDRLAEHPGGETDQVWREYLSRAEALVAEIDP